MNIEKIITVLVVDIKSDLDPKLFGTFGDTPDYVEGRLDDVIAIAKLINDDTLLKQFKAADNSLIHGNNKLALEILDDLTDKAE